MRSSNPSDSHEPFTIQAVNRRTLEAMGMNCPECDNLLRRTLRGTLWCVFCQRFVADEDAVMPRGSKVEKCFQKVKQETGDAGKAARICQHATGQALATGRKPRGKEKGK